MGFAFGSANLMQSRLARVPRILHVRQPIKSDSARPFPDSEIRPRKKFSRLKAPRQVHLEVANRIHRQRQKRCLSVTRLSQVSGLNRSHLQAIERGAPNLRISTMLQLVRALDTTIADLLRGVEATAEKTVAGKNDKTHSSSKLTKRKAKAIKNEGRSHRRRKS